MGNNITTINKTNNHLSLHTIKHKKNPRHMSFEIQFLSWDRHIMKRDRLNQLNMYLFIHNRSFRVVI